MILAFSPKGTENYVYTIYITLQRILINQPRTQEEKPEHSLWLWIITEKVGRLQHEICVIKIRLKRLKKKIAIHLLIKQVRLNHLPINHFVCESVVERATFFKIKELAIYISSNTVKTTVIALCGRRVGTIYYMPIRHHLAFIEAICS